MQVLRFLARGLLLAKRLYIFDRADGGEVQIRISLRQPLLVPIFLLALAWYITSPTGPSLVAALTLGLLLLTAYLWARTMARQVSGQRSLRYTAVQVGDELEERVSLSSTTQLPVLWAQFTDHSDLPGYTVTSVRFAGSRENITWRAHTTCTRRGIFSLGPWELRLGDPFGLFEVRQVYLQQHDLLVYPPLAPLPQRLIPRGRTQGEQRSLNQPLVAETASAFTARPYQPGDPLRHIHWPTTARRGEPFVKVFEPESSSTLWLVADCDAAVHGGEDDTSTLETMVILLASLASHLLNSGMAVGLFTISAAGQAIVLPRRGSAHLWQILNALAGLRSAPGQPFADTLRQAHALVSGRDLAVVVTPSLRPDWVTALHNLPSASPNRLRSAAQAILISRAGEAAAGQPSVDTFIRLLAEQGVPASVIGAGELKPASATYGELSRWEFKTLGTGRVYVRHAPTPLDPSAAGRPRPGRSGPGDLPPPAGTS